MDEFSEKLRAFMATASACAGRASAAPHVPALAVGAGIPPSSNHGGKTPSEQVCSATSERAHIDWLGLTLPIPDGVENVPSWAVVHLARFGFSNLTDKRKGWNGYQHQHKRTATH